MSEVEPIAPVTEPVTEPVKEFVPLFPPVAFMGRQEDKPKVEEDILQEPILPVEPPTPVEPSPVEPPVI